MTKTLHINRDGAKCVCCVYETGEDWEQDGDDETMITMIDDDDDVTAVRMGGGE